MQYAEAIFDIAGIGLFGLLVFTLASTAATRRRIHFSAVDFTIFGFTFWCVAIYLIYFEYAHVRDLAKLIIPMVSYTVAKNIMTSRSQYRSLLGWIIIGFAVPVTWSTVLILMGEGIESVSYWTGLARWEGAYTGSHSLGHSMTVFLIAGAIFVMLGRRELDGSARKASTIQVVAVTGLGAIAMFCLYKSQVRSAIFGLLTFAAVYFFFVNRKLFVVGTAALMLIALALLPLWLPALLPEFAMRQRGIEVMTLDLGSGRPRMWLSDLQVFAALPIDRQIAGVGIGNRGDQSADQLIYGHNDWLELMVQTGIVGVILYLTLQIFLFKAIRRVHGADRYVCLALFCAINAMMLVSNSFVWRIQVSQLYFILLALTELPMRSAAVTRVQGEVSENGQVAGAGNLSENYAVPNRSINDREFQ